MILCALGVHLPCREYFDGHVQVQNPDAVVQGLLGQRPFSGQM